MRSRANLRRRHHPHLLRRLPRRRHHRRLLLRHLRHHLHHRRHHPAPHLLLRLHHLPLLHLRRRLHRRHLHRRHHHLHRLLRRLRRHLRQCGAATTAPSIRSLLATACATMEGLVRFTPTALLARIAQTAQRGSILLLLRRHCRQRRLHPHLHRLRRSAISDAFHRRPRPLDASIGASSSPVMMKPPELRATRRCQSLTGTWFL